MQHKDSLAIYEVYYDDAGKVLGSGEKPTSPRGDSMEELQEDLARYTEALEKPILDYIE